LIQEAEINLVPQLQSSNNGASTRLHQSFYLEIKIRGTSITSILLSLLLLIFATGCGSDNSDPGSEPVYFLKVDGVDLNDQLLSVSDEALLLEAPQVHFTSSNSGALELVVDRGEWLADLIAKIDETALTETLEVREVVDFSKGSERSLSRTIYRNVKFQKCTVTSSATEVTSHFFATFKGLEKQEGFIERSTPEQIISLEERLNGVTSYGSIELELKTGKGPYALLGFDFTYEPRLRPDSQASFVVHFLVEKSISQNVLAELQTIPLSENMEIAPHPEEGEGTAGNVIVVKLPGKVIIEELAVHSDKIFSKFEVWF
jgi:hypothetical protein